MPLPHGVIPDRPGPGQESVWDYPRPPQFERVAQHVVVTFAGVVVCDTAAPIRVLETSHPPTYYLPLADWLPGALRPASGTSFCEWKGVAHYFDVVAEAQVAPRSAWTYPKPLEAAQSLVDHIAVYPEAMTTCTVDGEVALGQPGGFYGGWVTSRVVGPFKGAPGTMGW